MNTQDEFWNVSVMAADAALSRMHMPRVTGWAWSTHAISQPVASRQLNV